MEYFGAMFGHGKAVTRKGTKKSGMSMAIDCPDGTVGMEVKSGENGTHVTFRVTKDGRSHFIYGTFNDFFDENGKIEG